jgi:hypothetical protein
LDTSSKVILPINSAMYFEQPFRTAFQKWYQDFLSRHRGLDFALTHSLEQRVEFMNTDLAEYNGNFSAGNVIFDSEADLTFFILRWS